MLNIHSFQYQAVKEYLKLNKREGIANLRRLIQANSDETLAILSLLEFTGFIKVLPRKNQYLIVEWK